MTSIFQIGEETEAEEAEIFDFSSPEDVLIEIDVDEVRSQRLESWKGFAITGCTIIRGKEGVIGAASYDQSYGGFLDYTLEGLIECPRQVGFFVVEGVTGIYHKGDGWMTDDDMDFNYVTVRPATEGEENLL